MLGIWKNRKENQRVPVEDKLPKHSRNILSVRLIWPGGAEQGAQLPDFERRSNPDAATTGIAIRAARFSSPWAAGDIIRPGEPAREAAAGRRGRIAPDAVRALAARLLTVGSRIWRSKPIRRSTAIRGSGPVDDAHYSAVTAGAAAIASTPASATAPAAGIAVTAESSVAAVSAAMSMSSAAPILRQCPCPPQRPFLRQCPCPQQRPVLGRRGSAPARRGRRDPCAAVFRVRIGTCGDRSRVIEIFDNFTFAEVLGYGDLDVKTRMMCILASCIAEPAQTEFRTCSKAR